MEDLKPKQIEEYEANRQNMHKPLWNPTGLMIMSVFFSPIISMVIYVVNYHRLGDVRRRNIAVISYIVITLCILIGVLNFSEEFSKLIFAINFGIGLYMKSSQEKQYKEYIKMGGKSASFAMPLITSILIVAFFVFCMIYTAMIPDQYSKYYDDELYYTKNVTDKDVDQLANYLESIEFFAEDNNPISVKLDSDAATYIVSFVVNKDNINDTDAIDTFSYVRDELEQTVFTDKKVVVVFTDGMFKELRKIDE